MGAASDAEPRGGLGGRIGLLAGPALAAAVVAWTHPAAGAHGGLSAEGALTLGILALMSTWWVTQAVGFRFRSGCRIRRMEAPTS